MTQKTFNKKKDVDFELKKSAKKPKTDVKFDPSRKNKKYYIQKGYEGYEH